MKHERQLERFIDSSCSKAKSYRATVLVIPRLWRAFDNATPQHNLANNTHLIYVTRLGNRAVLLPANNRQRARFKVMPAAPPNR